MKIEKHITTTNILVYNFFWSLHDDRHKVKILICEDCGDELNSGYCYIINTLKDNNLLPKNYETLCCYCVEKKRKDEERRS